MLDCLQKSAFGFNVTYASCAKFVLSTSGNHAAASDAKRGSQKIINSE